MVLSLPVYGLPSVQLFREHDFNPPSWGALRYLTVLHSYTEFLFSVPLSLGLDHEI